MDYNLYLKWTQLTYEEFNKATYLIAEKFIYSILTIIVIYTIILIIVITRYKNYKLSTENRKKLKQICKWEKRPLKYQVKHILEMFIEAYTEKNNINWDETLY